MIKLMRNLLTLLLIHVSFLHAKEGMWIPSLLNAAQIGEMQSLGMQLTAEDIYSVEHGSLKDAICQFGGGCTAEVISPEGLILTNHHCGYGRIQSHSSLEHDYLTDGFWAMSRKEELPNDGLTVTFVVSIQDVTKEVLAGKEEGLTSAQIEKRITTIIHKETMGTYYEGKVLPFNYGNAYFLIVTETFKDVRLVGAPPSSIGKYGHDTDNWVWPRHTGDFSMFRIYADKNNNPAEYSADNVPYSPKHFLPVSLEGVKEGDFTMVYGFPGTTQQFLPSYAVDYILNHGNPAKIGMRDLSLSVINAAMKADKQVNIQYAAKQQGIANAWKKWIGESFGLNRVNALEKKKVFEYDYQRISNQNDSYKEFRNVLGEMQKVYQEDLDYHLAHDYYIEYIYRGPEIIRYAYGYRNLINGFVSMTEEERTTEIEKLRNGVEVYFKNYVQQVDRDIFVKLTEKFVASVLKDLLPADWLQQIESSKGGLTAYTDQLYNESIFASKEKCLAMLNNASAKSLKKIAAKDPAFLLANMLFDSYRANIAPVHGVNDQKIEQLLQLYVKGIRTMMPNRTYWYDANSTLRLTYGKVEGSSPMDGMKYEPFSTMEGVLQKYKPGDYEYDLPEKLVELAKKKDYGRYGQNGQLIVCFTGSNHTTGGNSGSPAINGEGYLVGLNFDRSWESTMSDVMYNADICRNIMVDIRYVLFIVDKFAGAGHLVDEMLLITPEYREKKRMDGLKVQLTGITDKIKAQVQNAELLAERGELYEQMDLMDDAMNDYEAALKIDKQHIRSLLGKGSVLIAKGECDAATQVLNNAVKIDKQVIRAQFLLGLACFEKGDYKLAVSAFTKAIELQKDHHKAYYNRGVCLHLLGKAEEGCNDLRMAQKLGGNQEEWIYKSVCE